MWLIFFLVSFYFFFSVVYMIIRVRQVIAHRGGSKPTTKKIWGKKNLIFSKCWLVVYTKKNFVCGWQENESMGHKKMMKYSKCFSWKLYHSCIVYLPFFLCRCCSKKIFVAVFLDMFGVLCYLCLNVVLVVRNYDI